MNKIYNKVYKNLSPYLLYVFMILLYIVFLLQSQDNDMFFEIMSGRDLLNGNFHTISHMNNFPIIVQQWLYAVCLAISDELGTLGNILLVLIQNIILWILSYIFMYNRTNDKKLSIIGPAIAILYCHDYMINIRPQIITVICIMTELILLDKYKKDNKFKYLLYMIPILILSANMHQAVFLYHGLMIIPYLYDNKYPYIDYKLVCFIPLLVSCSLLTPYGLDGSLYIVRTFMANTYDIIGITELNPISLTSYLGVKILILLAVTIYYVYKHKSNVYMNFYVFTLAILSLTTVRHISIMYISVIFVLCVIEYDIFTKPYSKSLFTLLCIGLCAVFLNNAEDIRAEYGEVANYIEDKDAPIYNTAMDVGGWLEYNGCTNIRLDSRCEAFSEEISGIPNIMENYVALTQGFWIRENMKYEMAEDKDLLKLLDDYTYVVSKTNQYVNRILKNNDDWILLFEDTSYKVYKRKTI